MDWKEVKLLIDNMIRMQEDLVESMGKSLELSLPMPLETRSIHNNCIFIHQPQIENKLIIFEKASKKKKKSIQGEIE